MGPVIGNPSSKELQDKGVLANLDINIFKLQDGVLGFNNYAQELKWLVTDDTRVSHISNIIKGLSGSGNTLVLIDRLATGEILNDKNLIGYSISGETKVPIGKKSMHKYLKWIIK